MHAARAGSGRAHGAASSTIVSRGQVAELGLDQYDVIALGGAEYRQAVTAAFTGTTVTVRFPFAGKSLSMAMAAAKAGNPLRRSARAIAAPAHRKRPDLPRGVAAWITADNHRFAELCKSLLRTPRVSLLKKRQQS